MYEIVSSDGSYSCTGTVSGGADGYGTTNFDYGAAPFLSCNCNKDTMVLRQANSALPARGELHDLRHRNACVSKILFR